MHGEGTASWRFICTSSLGGHCSYPTDQNKEASIEARVVLPPAGVPVSALRPSLRPPFPVSLRHCTESPINATDIRVRWDEDRPAFFHLGCNSVGPNMALIDPVASRTRWTLGAPESGTRRVPLHPSQTSPNARRARLFCAPWGEMVIYTLCFEW